jgi:hypothetical protein
MAAEYPRDALSIGALPTGTLAAILADVLEARTMREDGNWILIGSGEAGVVSSLCARMLCNEGGTRVREASTCESRSEMDRCPIS